MGNAAGDGGFSFNGAPRIELWLCEMRHSYFSISLWASECVAYVVYSVHNILLESLSFSFFAGWKRSVMCVFAACTAGKWELILTSINHHWTTTGWELLSMVQAHVSEQYFHRSLLFCVLAAVAAAGVRMKRVKFAVLEYVNVRFCSLIHCVFINLVLEEERRTLARQYANVCTQANLIYGSVQEAHCQMVFVPPP